MQAYDQIRLRQGEVTARWQRLSDTCDTPATRELEQDAAVIKSPTESPRPTQDGEHEMVNDEDIFHRGTVARRTDQSDFLRIGNSGIPPFSKMHVSLSPLGTTKTCVTETGKAKALERDARFMLPELTQNGVLNRLRTEWKRRGLLVWMNPPGGVVCWTSQFLSLMRRIGLNTGRVKDHHRVPKTFLAAEATRLDQRLRHRNKLAVLSFFLPTCLPVERAEARASSKENGKFHLVSCVAEVTISGDSVLNDTRKDLAWGGKNGSRTVLLGAAWGFASELFATVVLQADVFLDCGATETAGDVGKLQTLDVAVTFQESTASRSSGTGNHKIWTDLKRSCYWITPLPPPHPTWCTASPKPTSPPGFVPQEEASWTVLRQRGEKRCTVTDGTDAKCYSLLLVRTNEVKRPRLASSSLTARCLQISISKMSRVTGQGILANFVMIRERSSNLCFSYLHTPMEAKQHNSDWHAWNCNAIKYSLVPNSCAWSSSEQCCPRDLLEEAISRSQTPKQTERFCNIHRDIPTFTCFSMSSQATPASRPFLHSNVYRRGFSLSCL